MKTALLPLVAILVATISLKVLAAQDLYSAVVPVDNSSPAERDRALRDALGQVLVKLTGARTVVSRPEVRNFLAGAETLATEFGYVDIDDGDRKGLQARFAPAELDRFLRRNQLPVWPAKRKELLVWVLREPVAGARDFVPRDADEGFYDGLDRLFERRGQPVIYPLYDLEDQLVLEVEDGWNFNGERIAEASRRYGTDGWLIIRQYQTSDGGWRVAWVLSSGNDLNLDNLENPDLAAAMSQVVDGTVDRLAAGQTYIPSLAEGVKMLTVEGIDSFEDYARMVAILGELSVVRSADVDSLRGDRISFALRLEGDESEFFNALALFSEVDVPETTGGPVDRIRWRR